MVKDTFVPFGKDGTLDWSKNDETSAARDVAGKDKVVLQNYGRPYNDAGKPTGTYYKYAKANDEVISQFE